MGREGNSALFKMRLNVLNKHEAGYSCRTVEFIHSTMTNALSKTVTIGKIQKDPCIGVTIKGKLKICYSKTFDT